jgi:hypothetical protein
VKHYNDSILVRQLAFLFYDKHVHNFSDSARAFYIKQISRCLSCYRNTILYYTDNRMAQKKCYELYQNDLRYPDLILELKKNRFYKWLFITKFRFVWMFRKIEIKNLTKEAKK